MKHKEAEEHNSFHFGGYGKHKIKTLQQLLDALLDPQNEKEARKHLPEDRNDFSNWIKEVVKDEELAKNIESDRDIAVIAEKIKQRIEEHKIIEDAPAPVFDDDLKLHEENVGHLESAHGSNAESHHHTHIISEDLGKLSDHKEVLKKANEPRHFCPKFFECMKKEFFFGFVLGIIVGIAAVLILGVGI